MILHDPKTEKVLLRIARQIAAPNPLDTPDIRPWTGIWNRWFPILAALIFLYGILWGFTHDSAPASAILAMCGIIMMVVAKTGLGAMDSEMNRLGFFTTMVNLPIKGRTALSFIRASFIRMFWLPCTAFTLVVAIAVHGFPNPLDDHRVISTAAMLLMTVWATVTLAGTPLFHRLWVSIIWHVVAISIIAYFVCMHFIRGDLFAATPTEAAIISYAMWIFPPTWVFPGRLESGGAILAAIWATLGLWRWITWPVRAFALYDMPHDFLGAFGAFGYDESSWDEHHNTEDQESTPANAQFEREPAESALMISVKGAEISYEPPLEASSAGWLGRLIRHSIHPSDHTVAGVCTDPDANWTRRTNYALILAPIWLLITWIIKDHIPRTMNFELLHMVLWVVPVAGFMLLLLPLSNAVPRGTGPWNLGGVIVPLFSALPVAAKTLLRVSLRITIVRGVVMAVTISLFYWVMAQIYGKQDIARGMLALFPAMVLFWVCSRPIFVWHRLRQAVEARQRGATGSLLLFVCEAISLAFWFITGVTGIVCSFLWAAGIGDPIFREMQLPITLIGLFLSFASARAVFWVFVIVLRKRHFDWKSKIQ